MLGVLGTGKPAFALLLTHQLKQLRRQSHNYRSTKQTKTTLTTHRQPQPEPLENTSRRWRRDHAPSLLHKLFLETYMFLLVQR
jgi:hypothetical protein